MSVTDAGDPGATLPADGTSDGLRGQAPRKRAADGSEIGRYVVLSQIGSGGMGVVYAAYDPGLDRKVALKVLRGDDGRDTRGSERHERLLREAQAMASLSHPNVVAVHDVGEHEGQVFIAMEYVKGRDLGTWLEEGDRAWEEVVDRFIRAGRGLAAAHAEGLVHRDFKPDNVMLGDDGRVRVMDFGLARRGPGDEKTLPSSAETGPGPSTHESSSLGTRLTRAGSLLGTPAYMAPEQWAGVETDARTDQFSFCVALWEGVYGQRPFGGESMAALAFATSEGNVREPQRHGVPRWVRQVLGRGLASDPGERYPSMGALLRDLERGQGRRRRRIGLAVAAVVGLVTGAALFARQVEHERHVAACELAGSEIEAVWTNEEREQVRAVLAEQTKGNTGATLEMSMALLDEFVADWRRLRTDVCLKTEVTGEWDESLGERGRTCLDMRLDELRLIRDRALVERDDASVWIANSLTKLDEIENCGDRRWLEATPAPPAEFRAEVRQLEREVRAVTILDKGGDYTQGVATIEELVIRAEAIGWEPLVADTKSKLGAMQRQAGQYKDAERNLTDAYFTAIRSGARFTALEAANRLVGLVGIEQSRPVDGLLWARHAEVLVDELPDSTGLGESVRLGHVSALHRWLGHYDQALDASTRSRDLAERTLDPRHPYIASALNREGNIYWELGELDRAATAYRRSLQVKRAYFGEGHPLLASGLNNLGGVLIRLGRLDDAEAALDEALTIRETALGPDHPAVASVLENQGGLYVKRGDLEAAETALARALSIGEAQFGGDSPKIIDTLITLTTFELARERPDAAVGYVERAIRILDSHDHAPVQVGEARFLLAQALHAQGDDLARARENARLAREAYRSVERGSKGELAEVEAWLDAHPLVEGEADAAGSE